MTRSESLMTTRREKDRQRRRPVLLAALAFCAVLPAQPVLTLPMALRQAQGTSLQAGQAERARQTAQGDRDLVEAAFFPDIQFQGGHLNQDQDTVFKGSPVTLDIPGLGALSVPGQDQSVAQKSSWRYQVSASYLVYDFGRRGHALAAAKGRQAAVDLQGQDALGRALAQVAARYMGVMNLQAQKKVVEQRRIALQDHLADAQALFDQGVVARNDLLRTGVALRAVADAARTLDNAERSAREGLNIALGLAPGDPLNLPDGLAAPPPLPWDEGQVQRAAPEANAGVQALEAKLRAAGDQVVFRRRDYAPSLTAQLAHSYQEDQFLLHPDQTTLYLGVAWKLFDGGTRAARVSQSRVDEQSARRDLLEARRQVENAAGTAFRDFQEALAEMATAQANVVASQENLRIVNDQYQQAYAKSADVLDAETVLAESRFSVSDRLCRAYAQQAALLALMGEDLGTFYASHPPEP